MNKITNVCFENIKCHVETDDNNLNNVLKYYPFGNDERYLGMELLNNTQNAKNWIVGKITKK